MNRRYLLLILLASSPQVTQHYMKNSGMIKFDDVTPWGDWQHYHNYTEIVNTLRYLNDTYPSIVDVFSIGKSWQDREIYCIRLTDEHVTHSKPEVFFVGYHHARELISMELPLYFAVEAATSYGTDVAMTRMIDNSQIYIVVALNVDGFEGVESNEWQRKNLHPFDEDEDGLVDEDSPDDEDGDGYVEALRQRTGTEWSLIRWEGVDDDGDGLLNEDWIGGVDLNRNYPCAWDAATQSGSTDPGSETYKGPEPFSEPETQAIRDLALKHDFKYAISFHSGIEIVIYPWSYTDSPTPDDSTFRETAAALSSLVGVPYAQSGGGMYTSSGVWGDWIYENRSTFAFTCEIYGNDDAWQYDPGPYRDSWWEKGVFEFFNPEPENIEGVVLTWLPSFTYITNKAIAESAFEPSKADLNGDGIVNVIDLSIVAHSYGSRPGDERWNEANDLNNDQVINILDLAFVASEYGEKAS